MDDYAEYTPERAAHLCGVDADAIREIATVIGANLGRLATHTWRAAGGRQPGRLAGGALPVLPQRAHRFRRHRGWHQPQRLEQVHPGATASRRPARPLERADVADRVSARPPRDELPAAVLPQVRSRPPRHLLHRVYNPVWTNPDGFSWIEVLTDTDLVGCHVALTPTWSETAWFADYVLPMGVGTERHDVASYETHAGRWIGFRQPVLRRHAELSGSAVERTYETNPGEVWEENEFWIDLSWRIDPDGELGIRTHFESLERPGEPIGVDEYYQHSSSPTPSPACRRPRPRRAFRRWSTCAATAPSRSPATSTTVHERALSGAELADTVRDEDGVYRVPGTAGLHDELGRDRRAHAVHRRRLARCRGRRHAAHRLPDAVAQTRAVLADAGRVGLAGVRDADLDPQPRPLGRPRPRRRRAHPHPHVPAPDADPHQVRELEVAERDQPPPPAVDPPAATPSSSASASAGWPDHDPHRSLRDRDVAHRGHPARAWSPARITWVAGASTSSRATSAGRQAWPTSSTTATGWDLRLRHGVETVRERRPRFVAGVVDRLRCAPEPHVPAPARPGVGDALLVAASDDHAGRARRPRRRRPRRHGGIDGRVRGVAAADPPRPGPREPTPSTVVRPAGQAGRNAPTPTARRPPEIYFEKAASTA